MKFSRTQAETWWRIALNDVGISESSAVLFEFAERDDGYVGKAWLRCTEIDNEADKASLREQLAIANSAAVKVLGRVAVRFEHSTIEGLAGAIRHELEHTRQLDSEDGEELSDRFAVAEEVIGEAGRNEYSSQYFNIPMEADANAAASVFVRANFGDQRIEELILHGAPEVAFYRSKIGPLPLETLKDRMKRFIVEDNGPRTAFT